MTDKSLLDDVVLCPREPTEPMVTAWGNAAP